MMVAMLLLRRFLVFQFFLCWQGGFLFYSAVVVPIGTELLGSALLQGTITQLVTNWLNLIGVGWCLVMLWDVRATQRTSPVWLRRTRLALLFSSILMLVALFVIHPRLDELLDAEALKIAQKRQFRFWHIIYLWISTFHWLFGLVLALLTLAAWRREDQPMATKNPSE